MFSMVISTWCFLILFYGCIQRFWCVLGVEAYFFVVARVIFFAVFSVFFAFIQMDKFASLGINGDIIDGKDFKLRENLNVK